MFPLFAGTFGPVATAFSIFASSQDWRVKVDGTSEEQEGIALADPPWQIAVNAVSLVVALCTNVLMLFG